MAFVTTRDILEQVRRVHRKLSGYYAALSKEADKAKVKMLLNYLSRHERHFDESLADYEETAAHAVMNTYFEFTPDECVYEALDQFDLHHDMTLDDVVEVIRQVDDRLIDLFRCMAEKSDKPEVREMFENLLEQEQHEKIQTMKQALEIERM